MSRPNIWSYFTFTFLTLILAGTLILKLPMMYKGDLSFIDALFTSTSAVCVTGLSVTNTSNFTILGQIVIIVLIQLGGLGIMILTTSIFLFIRGELNLKQRLVVTNLTDIFSMNEAEYIVRYIIFYTFLIEFIGFIFLTFGFWLDGYTIVNAFYYGLFHSISAFCNAGFSPFDNSLIGMNWVIKLTIMILIIFGGLGFYVIYDIHQYLLKGGRLKNHTKIVTISTLLLILFGFIVFNILEHEMDIIDGFFQSVTARTAGFNSVDLTNLTQISKFTLIILMIIGASPGGTGGGIKTSTFALALLSIVNILKGVNRLVIFKREVPNFQILRSFSLIAAYIFVLVTSTLAMLYFYNYDFMDMLFEVASALGTVGLSLGITSKIGTEGKLILIFCMFIGRIGTSALISSLLGYEKTNKINYPQEKIILG
ncbi:MAG: potassium transporter [Calditerrivibrio sp.]|nr:potassium transporter [Calditerrivibrio sp.]